ncbi:hypothetical protein ACP4OV_008789 [Aristida adscensionis]
MASLLLFLRAIADTGGADDRPAGAMQEEEKRQKPEMRRLASAASSAAAYGLREGVADEEERWLVACLQWPRVDRKSAWMQIV